MQRLNALISSGYCLAITFAGSLSKGISLRGLLPGRNAAPTGLAGRAAVPGQDEAGILLSSLARKLQTARDQKELGELFLDSLAARFAVERGAIYLCEKGATQDERSSAGQLEPGMKILTVRQYAEGDRLASSGLHLGRHSFPVFYGQRQLAIIHLNTPRELAPNERALIESLLPALACGMELNRNRREIGVLQKKTEDLEKEIALLNGQLSSEKKEKRGIEEWYRGVIDSAPDGILIADEKGIIIQANPAIEQMFAHPPGFLIGKPIEVLVPESLRLRHQKLRHSFAQMQAPTGTKRKIGEQEGVRADGTIFPAEIGLATLPARGGRPPCLFASVRDISQRQKTANELRQANEEQIAILETATTGIAFVKDRKVVRCNRMLERLFGCNRDELIGTPTRTCFPNDRNYALFCDSIQEDFNQGISYSKEMQFLRKDGSLFWCRLTGNAVAPLDPSRGSVWILDDITEQKRAEQIEKDERNRLQRILDSSPACISFVVDHRIVFCNSAFHEKFGAKQGDDVLSFYVRKEARNEWLTRLKREGAVKEFELELLDSETRTHTMLGTFLPVSLCGQEGELGWLTDITERKQAESDLQTRIGELERFNLLSINREEKMIQLKKEINDLLEQIGEKRKYQAVDQESTAHPCSLAADIENHQKNNEQC